MYRPIHLHCLAVIASLVLSAPALAAGDPDKGGKVFKQQCQRCHVADAEKKKIGPHLVGLFGRQSGSVERFKYSKAMTDAGITWSEETLFGYLENPKEYLEGNRMKYRGLKKEQDRNDLIAYLKQATAKQ